MTPPRPDFLRTNWFSLDGLWDFAFDPDGTGPDDFGRTILVPFPWESRLSGVGVTDYHGVAWYRRRFAAPERSPGYRVHLCFGAVDQSCRVWVNQVEVGSHAGGYTPFRFDITDALLDDDNEVVVRVLDETDPHLPTGKQVGWYTTNSGLWQPVWLELVAPVHTRSLAVEACLDPPQARIEATIYAPYPTLATVRITRPEEHQPKVITDVELRAGDNRLTLVLPVPEGRPWSPEDPYLYEFCCGVYAAGLHDQVHSQFGLRTIATGTAPNGQPCVLLNGQPVYLRGALHQMFRPDGLYAFPDAQAMYDDLERAKELGWNFLRLHILLADPRFLHYADRLGILLMADLPNTWQYSPRARDAWEAQLREAIPRDGTHPSVIAWCCFNETWGLGGEAFKQDTSAQHWVEAMWRLAKELDPTRLVEDNSPCRWDHVDTDLNTWHFYLDDPARAAEHVQHVVDQTFPGSPLNYCPGRVQGGQPLLNSEYGAVGSGGGDRDIAWSFRYLTTLLRAQPKCQGYVYTEFCDLEWEHNGLLCYDRTPKVYGYDAFVAGMTPADLQGADFVGFHGPPVQAAAAGTHLDLTAFVSHYSDLTAPPLLRWQVVGWDTLGQPLAPASAGQVEVPWRPADVVELPVAVELPAALAIGAVTLELVSNGQRLAANYVNLLGRSEPLPTVEAIDPCHVAVRLPVSALAAADGVDAEALVAQIGHDKLWATGRPSFTWRVRLSPAMAAVDHVAVTLLVEAGACGGEAKLDWPARRNPLDYPQTKLGRTTPSTLRARLGGVEMGVAPLADDAADARGVLSHLAGFHHGSHGQRVALTLDLTGQPQLLARLTAQEVVELTLDVPPDAAAAHGLSIYGERLGRYVLAPTLLFESADAVHPTGAWCTEPLWVDAVRPHEGDSE